jgi:hypothetical protein
MECCYWLVYLLGLLQSVCFCATIAYITREGLSWLIRALPVSLSARREEKKRREEKRREEKIREEKRREMYTRS